MLSMKKTRFLLLQVTLLLLAALLLFGCGAKEDEKMASYNFKQGISELNLNFLSNAPPDKIYQNSEFKIVVELANEAAYDIEDGSIRLVNIDPNYFLIEPIRQEFEPLMGRSLVNPAGDKQFIEFLGTAKMLFENAQQYVGNYLVKVKYHSTMEFTDSLCINPNLYEVYDSGCVVEERKTYSGQGAPLAVTEVEEVISPGMDPKVEFRVRLRNQGKGKVLVVELGKARLGNLELNCHFPRSGVGEKKIELKENIQEAILICDKGMMQDFRSYMTTLYLDFSYDYELEVPHRLNLMRWSKIY